MTGHPHRLKPGRRLTILLALLTTVGPYTVDAFFPSMRAMAAYFGVTTFQVQQALTAFMLPFAMASLVHGSLSDALGRRRVIITGLSLYSMASLGCAFAPGFGTFLAMRACQGAVVGAGMIVARAIVRDLYSGAPAQRAMSTMTMVFALGPALAPVVGGWLQVAFGWRSVFLSMAGVGVLLTGFAWRYLPETLPTAKRSPLHVGAILRSIGQVMRHREFLLLTAASALCFVVLQVYIASAPAIILDHWHGTETGFAMLTVPLIGGYTLGAFMSGRLAGKLAPERQARIGYALMFGLTTLMLVVQLAWPGVPVLVQQVLLASTTFGLQLMYPVVMLKILDLFPDSRGAATSANSFLGMMLSAFTMGTLAPLLSHSMQLLALCAFIASIAGWSFWQISRRVLGRA